ISNDVTILLGTGSGMFSQAPGSPVAVGSAPRSVAAGDWNGDGRLDLATANLNSNNVTILLGNGPGGLSHARGSPVAVGSDPFSVAAGDLNGDGLLYPAILRSISNDVTILLGTGSGGFSQAPGSPVAVGSAPRILAAGDVNGDGKLDLAVPNSS